jgi:hypothetical protein
MDSIGDELLTRRKYLDLDLLTVRQNEFGRLELRELAIGPVDKQGFRRIADAYKGSRAEPRFDSVQDLVRQLLQGHVDVEGDDLPAKQPGIERARIGGY